MFLTRLMSGIVLVILAIASISLGGNVLLCVVTLLGIIGFLELTGTMGNPILEDPSGKGVDTTGKIGFKGVRELSALQGIGALYSLLYGGGLLACVWCPIDKMHLIFFMLIGAFLLFMFVYVFSFPRYTSQDIMAAIASFIYAPVCLSCLYFTRELPLGVYTVWLIFLCSWGCDTCAYCVGVLFGKHKMSPVLSPKKSVEGAFGGVLGAMLLGVLYALWVNSTNAFSMNVMLPYVIICGIGALISMVGDLAASAIKRNHGMKDYNKLIPGHGGILDRFDSVIFTAPVIYLLAYYLL